MRVLVYGSGEFGRVISALVTDCGHDFAGYIDDSHCHEEVVGNYDTCRVTHSPSHYAVAIAIGYRWLAERPHLLRKVQSDGYATPCLIHPSAYVATSAKIGSATFIMARSVIDSSATVGDLCVVWPGAVVNHDSHLHTNIFVGPNATLCGISTIGSHSFLGAGAVIVDHVNVPEYSFVKAGTVFHRDSPKHFFNAKYFK